MQTIVLPGRVLRLQAIANHDLVMPRIKGIYLCREYAEVLDGACLIRMEWLVTDVVNLPPEPIVLRIKHFPESAKGERKVVLHPWEDGSRMVDPDLGVVAVVLDHEHWPTTDQVLPKAGEHRVAVSLNATLLQRLLDAVQDSPVTKIKLSIAANADGTTRPMDVVEIEGPQHVRAVLMPMRHEGDTP